MSTVSCPRCRVSFSRDALPTRTLAVGDPCPWWRDGSECRRPLTEETRDRFVRIVRLVVEW